ncbi:MAG: TlpA family protein disulfide reductase [Candidatus Eremiobacteraeota bacterium]|nr:TlpA family protein disulfide reductase [Candidatus Eremiobacteraeota bacterium]
MRLLPMRQIGFLLSFLFCGWTAAGAAAPPRSGQPAPQIDGLYSSGGTFRLFALRGKAVYLNFFATWCPPCNDEAPDVNALQKKYRKRGLVVLGVDALENAGKANEFVHKFNLSYKAVADPQGQIRDAYGINALPVHVFIDRRGKIKLYRMGQMNKSEIEAAIKSIL